MRSTGACEVDERACPFVDRELVRWDGPTPGPLAASHPLGRGGVIVADFRVAPLDRGSIASVGAILRDGPDFVLLGHHGGPQVNFPPSFLAAAALAEGLRPWVTVACRDRDRLAVESELAALAALAVDGVHCVTGDYVGPGVVADVSPVFDLDAFGLVALARRHGLATSVAANPASPPVGLRPGRIVEKVRAGAGSCFVNHAGPIATTAGFITAARCEGAHIPFLPCVPVVTDGYSASVLGRFPGVVLPPQLVESILGAPDPERAGIDAAVGLARALLAVDGVAGVNLSGAACGGAPEHSARIMATVARAIGAS